MYGGKTFDSLARVRAACARIPSIEHVVVVPYLERQPSLAGSPGGVLWPELIANAVGQSDFEQFPFEHPLYILYSSGTTWPPQCIVHSAGGILLKHLKEHLLHVHLRPDDRVFYFTTCGWMRLLKNLLCFGLGGSTVRSCTLSQLFEG